MSRTDRKMRILMAEDDREDYLLTIEAFEESGVSNEIEWVQDGEALMRYLRKENPFVDVSHPDLVLLDLNLPRKDGREALEEIKSDVELRRIPIVVFSTSQEEGDVLRMYKLGVNSYITKPMSFAGLVETVLTLQKYWFNVVLLPTNH